LKGKLPPALFERKAAACRRAGLPPLAVSKKDEEAMKLARTRIKRSLILTLAVLLCSLILTMMLSRRHAPARVANGKEASTATSSQKTRETYGRIPLSFEANRGQTENSVNFLARGAGYTLFLQPTEATFVLRNADFGMRNEDAARTRSPQSAARN
jgi:hypothetical protein